MPQVAQAPVPLAGQAQMELSQAQNNRVAQRSELRSRVLERVDQLVRGMEAVAQRLSSDGVSTAQRSLLVARFNELQRRVNEIDGVVGSEGRADAVAPSGTPLAQKLATVAAPVGPCANCPRCERTGRLRPVQGQRVCRQMESVGR